MYLLFILYGLFAYLIILIYNYLYYLGRKRAHNKKIDDDSSLSHKNKVSICFKINKIMKSIFI